MDSTHERFVLNCESKFYRKLTAGIAAFGLLSSNAVAANNNHRPSQTYDLSGIYPDLTAVQQGLHLEGANVDPAHDGERAVLWFETNGTEFAQHSHAPGDPNGNCASDILAWKPGANGGLIYSETDDNCGPVDKTYHYNDGLVFAPRYWQEGQAWSKSGVSNTSYFENGMEVCSGLNRWRSYVVGEMVLASGTTVLHTHTTEYQDWQPVPGAPASSQCPAGSNGPYKWNENFYFAQQLPVKDHSGNIIGYLPGLARSFGGNATRPGGTHWDVRLTSWQK